MHFGDSNNTKREKQLYTNEFKHRKSKKKKESIFYFRNPGQIASNYNYITMQFLSLEYIN